MSLRQWCTWVSLRSRLVSESLHVGPLDLSWGHPLPSSKTLLEPPLISLGVVREPKRTKPMVTAEERQEAVAALKEAVAAHLPHDKVRLSDGFTSVVGNGEGRPPGTIATPAAARGRRRPTSRASGTCRPSQCPSLSTCCRPPRRRR